MKVIWRQLYHYPCWTLQEHKMESLQPKQVNVLSTTIIKRHGVRSGSERLCFTVIYCR